MTRSICLFLLIAAFFSGCSKIPDVTVYDDPEFPERTYSLKQGGREVEWIVYTSGVNSGVILHRARWDGLVHGSVPWMKKILGRILQDYDRQYFHTLLTGRLELAFGENNTEISERFMVAAKKSGLWDPVKGKSIGISKHEAGLFAEFCDTGHVFKEFAETFGEYGMKLRMSATEKTLISRVKDIPVSADFLKTHPVISSEDILPFDCMVWLKIIAE